MKKYILFLLLIPSIIFAQNLEELKKKAQKENTAKSWNDLAKYYYDKEGDTTDLKKAAQQGYSLALKEKSNREIGHALILLSENYAHQSQWDKFIKQNEEASEYLFLTKDFDLQRTALGNIGYAYNVMGEYENAICTHQKIIDISTTNNLKDEKLSQGLINLAFSYLYKGNIDSTTYFATKALNVASLVKDTITLIEAYNHLGIIHKRQGDFKKALEYYEASLQLYELTGDRQKTSFVWMNIATLYSDWKKHDKALEIARKATRLAFKDGLEDNYIGGSLSNLGQLLLQNKQYASGLDTLKLAQPYLKENKYQTYILYLSLSKAFELNNYPDSCLAYLKKAEDILSQYENYPAARLYQYKGTLFVRQGKYNEAISILEKYVKGMNPSIGRRTADAYEMYDNLAKAYELGLKDYRKALHYKNLAFIERDSLYKQEHNDKISDFYAQYQTAEKELEISLLNEERQEMLYNRTLIIGGFVILAVILLFALLYSQFLRLKKEKEALGLSIRINEKEAEYQALVKESEFKQMRHYLDGLEAERDRLAKVLHDNVANRLYILDQELKKLNNIPAGIPQQIEQLYNEVRGISHQLISPLFQYTTLSEILHNHIQDLNESTCVNFQLRINNEDVFESISPDMSHEIYRIIQECTGNITKHSSAKNAKILLTYNNNSIELIIEDDGIGFDSQIKSRGIGIQIIKDRCETLNGNLQIVSEKGKGCKIKANIPFTPSPSTQSNADELQ